MIEFLTAIQWKGCKYHQTSKYCSLFLFIVLFKHLPITYGEYRVEHSSKISKVLIDAEGKDDFIALKDDVSVKH